MKILMIGPHGDDGALGAGATIAKRIHEGHEVYHCVVTGGINPNCGEELMGRVKQEVRDADRYLGVRETIFLNFPSVRLETVERSKLNGKILEVIQTLRPDEAYIPHWGDMQLDHRLVVDAAMVALRPKYQHRVSRIYAYETLSETGWHVPNMQNAYIPNVYEDVTETIEKKLEALRIYKLQMMEFPAARSLEAIEALARFRGATVGVRAAEAFSLVRELR